MHASVSAAAWYLPIGQVTHLVAARDCCAEGQVREVSRSKYTTT